ncbi:MAG: hypothetical protein JXJ04_06675 [Spirochaetales bacterium]|nr:hypothetical protein [Spirochaetales bacterium]
MIFKNLCLLLCLYLLLTMCSKPTALKEHNIKKDIFIAMDDPDLSNPGLKVDSNNTFTHDRLEEKSPEDLALLFPNALLNKDEVARWVQAHFTDYFQHSNLSCEAAIIRLTIGIWGITDLSEDDILALMPTHPSNPELGLVMENIRGDVYFKDGSINWANYGAHPPVVKQTLETILKKRNLDSLYWIDQQKLDNKSLITLIRDNQYCLGAIIWVAAYIDNEKPPINEIGQVLGEHVQFVSPILSKQGRMLVYDVWPWEKQPFHLSVPFNRDMFDYETLLIMKKK